MTQFLRNIFLILLIIALFYINQLRTYAKDVWYYPMENAITRVRMKPFGQFLDEKFYQDKEKLFPGPRYLGQIHAGADMEVTKSEINKLTPFYAVHSGKIVFADTVEGYGGLVLFQIDDGLHTALYGHVKLKSLKGKVDQKIKAGQLLGYLGDNFSEETTGERKHLHFGIYKGHDLYFRGHEYTQEDLKAIWENPLKFLKQKNALMPGNKIQIKGTDEKKPGRNFFTNLFNLIFHQF